MLKLSSDEENVKVAVSDYAIGDRPQVLLVLVRREISSIVSHRHEVNIVLWG